MPIIRGALETSTGTLHKSRPSVCMFSHTQQLEDAVISRMCLRSFCIYIRTLYSMSFSLHHTHTHTTLYYYHHLIIIASRARCITNPNTEDIYIQQQRAVRRQRSHRTARVHVHSVARVRWHTFRVPRTCFAQWSRKPCVYRSADILLCGLRILCALTALYNKCFFFSFF